MVVMSQAWLALVHKVRVRVCGWGEGILKRISLAGDCSRSEPADREKLRLAEGRFECGSARVGGSVRLEITTNAAAWGVRETVNAKKVLEFLGKMARATVGILGGRHSSGASASCGAEGQGRRVVHGK